MQNHGRSSTCLLWQLLLIATAASVLPHRAMAQNDLTELSLEELFNVEVTTASRRPEPRSEAAAALSVISGSDIAKMGATNIPDALRLIPGVHVARIDAAKWAVSVRGFSNRFSNKLLVLMDGRTLYTPLFAGVFWDVQDTYLDDIERIEVIRGPGGAMWGANAVNGVINILSRSATETQGIDAYAGGGSEERAFGGVRYGGKLGDTLAYRVYTRFENRDGGSDPPPALANFDDWWSVQGGFRADWQLTRRDTITLQGDAYGGKTSAWGSSAVSADVNGANLLARWRREISRKSELSVQTYYDGTLRDDPYFNDRRHTFDIDMQHTWRPLPWDELVWGLQYRVWGDIFHGSPAVELDPDSRTVNTVSAFVENGITLFDDRLRVSIGTRVDHNDFTGFEVQPSARASWSVIRDLTLWAAVSRAVRVPSRLENDLLVQSAPGTTPAFRLDGSNGTDAEKLLSYQAGIKYKPMEHGFFELTGFYNDYSDLVSFDLGMPSFEPDPPPGQFVIPVTTGNAIDGEIYGAEIAVIYQPLPWWRLRSSYSYLETSIHTPASSVDPQNAEGSSPVNKSSLWAQLDLPLRFQGDAVLRYVDSLPNQQVSSYLELDLRLAREIVHGVELSLVGRDLLQASHREFAGGSKVQRSVYGRVRVTF